jgi:hypothetical protein
MMLKSMVSKPLPLGIDLDVLLGVSKAGNAVLTTIAHGTLSHYLTDVSPTNIPYAIKPRGLLPVACDLVNGTDPLTVTTRGHALEMASYRLERYDGMTRLLEQSIVPELVRQGGMIAEQYTEAVMQSHAQYGRDYADFLIFQAGHDLTPDVCRSNRIFKDAYSVWGSIENLINADRIVVIKDAQGYDKDRVVGYAIADDFRVVEDEKLAQILAPKVCTNTCSSRSSIR